MSESRADECDFLAVFPKQHHVLSRRCEPRGARLVSSDVSDLRILLPNTVGAERDAEPLLRRSGKWITDPRCPSV